MRAVLRTVVVSVVVALAGAFLAPLPATAAPYATVSGVVTGPGGRALADVEIVRIYLLRKSGKKWTAVRSDIADAAGGWRYSLPVLKKGTFKVRAVPKGGAYAENRSRAKRIGPGARRVNVALKSSGAVTGRVTGIPAGLRRGTATLWRHTPRKTWTKVRTLRLSDQHTYVFGARPGRYRVSYSNSTSQIWAPTTRTLTVRGKARVTAPDLVTRPSKSVSGSVTRVGFDDNLFLWAEVRSAGGWKQLPLSTRVPGESYIGYVPGAGPQVRLRVSGGENHPQVYWNGTATGTTVASRAKVIDLSAGPVTGVDFTIPRFREFATAQVRVTGRAKVGSKFTATGTWSPRAREVRYQWRRGTSEYLLGQTKPTYTIRKADRGKRVWLTVRIERPWYRPTSLTSNRTAVVR